MQNKTELIKKIKKIRIELETKIKSIQCKTEQNKTKQNKVATNNSKLKKNQEKKTFKARFKKKKRPNMTKQDKKIKENTKK